MLDKGELKPGTVVTCRGEGDELFKIAYSKAFSIAGESVFLNTYDGKPYGWKAVDQLTVVERLSE